MEVGFFPVAPLPLDMPLLPLLRVYHSILHKGMHNSYLLDKVGAVTLIWK